MAIAGIGLGSMDYESDTITLDATSAALFGMEAEKSIARPNLHARFHPDDADKIAEQIARVVDPAGDGFMAIDHRIVRPDGSIRWVSARKQVEFGLDANGGRVAKTGLLALLDITDRKRAETQLRQNEALFATLVEQAPTGVYVVDSEFRLMQVNARAAPVFKMVHPLVGRDFTEIMQILWGGEQGTALAAIFRNTLLTGEPYVSPQYSSHRFDLGVNETYEWQTQRVTLPDGRHGVVCYFNDVTERTRREDDRAEREAHVRSILDNTLAFIGLLDLDGTLLEANVPALIAGGVSRADVVGRKFWETPWFAHDPAEVERLKDAVARCKVGEVARYDANVRMAGDTRMAIDFMLAPVRDALGNVTLLVPSGLDITARKRDLQHIRTLMDEVNHRARNLLSVVMAVARQTARGGDPQTFVMRLFDRVNGFGGVPGSSRAEPVDRRRTRGTGDRATRPLSRHGRLPRVAGRSTGPADA